MDVWWGGGGSEQHQLSVGQVTPAYWPVDSDWLEVKYLTKGVGDCVTTCTWMKRSRQVRRVTRLSTPKAPPLAGGDVRACVAGVDALVSSEFGDAAHIDVGVEDDGAQRVGNDEKGCRGNRG